MLCVPSSAERISPGWVCDTSQVAGVGCTGSAADTPETVSTLHERVRRAANKVIHSFTLQYPDNCGRGVARLPTARLRYYCFVRQTQAICQCRGFLLGVGDGNRKTAHLFLKAGSSSSQRLRWLCMPSGVSSNSLFLTELSGQLQSTLPPGRAMGNVC